MAVTTSPYGLAGLALGVGGFDLSADTINVILTTSGYTPNVDTDEFLSDVTNEITGTGYTGGGQTLTGVSWTYDATNHRSVLAADPVIWTTATFTARRAVVFQDTGTPAASRLLSCVDFGADKAPVAVDFNLAFTDGVYWIALP